ncbi:MAG: TonB family protein [Verrucomicrobia bacterium]|nr:TonB family protein [Verrucomicrobiota bacterium]
MNRLEKKCLLGSAALHGLLMVAFLFGSAFFTPKGPKLEDLGPVLTFTRLTDEKISTGGNPNAPRENAPAPQLPPPPVATPPAPVPTPPPPKVEKTPEPAKETAKPKEHEPEPKTGDDPTKATKSTKPKDTHPKLTTRINTNATKRAAADLAAAKVQREADEKARREYAAYQKRWGEARNAFDRTVSNVGHGLVGNVASSVDVWGPGGGPAVSNWRAAVAACFDNAWNPPAEANESATVKVTVTIARDGSVMASDILSSSSDSAVNRSVQRVLRDVRNVPPFPEGAKEERRTLTIEFNLNAKRRLG